LYNKCSHQTLKQKQIIKRQACFSYARIKETNLNAYPQKKYL